MIAIERLIEQSARYLGGLSRSTEVIDFALSKPNLVEEYLREYNEVIQNVDYTTRPR